MPIVFPGVADPIGAGFVDGLARPGRNATGFMLFEFGMSGKWLELAERDRTRRDARGGFARPVYTAGDGQFAAIQALAPSLGVELRPDRCARCW